MCTCTRSLLISFLVVLTVGLVVALSPKGLLSGNGGQGIVNAALADGGDGDDHDGDDHDGDHHYGHDGYDEEGRDRDGRDRDGYDHEGYSSKGHDREGYDHEGYRDNGRHRDGHYDSGHDRHKARHDTPPPSNDAQPSSGGPPAPTYTPQKAVIRQY